ncbi:IniB N-terminal domain-containing protein [Pseudonocardia spinosispora]|uniref:IniB N-terminal domain-containing protein n=1 Tax=Pseudonocardia spinosispora TaxID=103441 RepID=UPI0012EC1CEF|nr:IniB N-terminal domain-containing protein [Pseudonocardia spinosispora]
MSTASPSLLDWIMELFRNPEARAEFRDDPRGYAEENGFENLSAGDVRDALCLVADSQSAGYDHRGGNGGTHYPPPPRHDDDGRDDHDNDDGPRYLNNYITNNYETIEENTTNIDNSVHQNVDTDGGDFSQVIDNDPVVASGDGSVAAGGDISDSTLTTGDGNVVGDGNQAVTGDDNTSAFGSGDATDTNLEDVRFGDGSAASFGGDASGSSSDDDTTTAVRNSGSGDTSVNAAGSGGYADDYSDQSSTDDSTHSNYTDDSRVDSHDSINSDNESRYSDSNDIQHA